MCCPDTHTAGVHTLLQWRYALVRGLAYTSDIPCKSPSNIYLSLRSDACGSLAGRGMASMPMTSRAHAHGQQIGMQQLACAYDPQIGISWGAVACISATTRNELAWMCISAPIKNRRRIDVEMTH